LLRTLNLFLVLKFKNTKWTYVQRLCTKSSELVYIDYHCDIFDVTGFKSLLNAADNKLGSKLNFGHK